MTAERTENTWYEKLTAASLVSMAALARISKKVIVLSVIKSVLLLFSWQQPNHLEMAPIQKKEITFAPTAIDPASRLSALIICLLTAGSGGLVYFYLSLKLRLVDKLVGPQARKWRRRLRIK